MICLRLTACFKWAVRKKSKEKNTTTQEPGVLLKHSYIPQNEKKKKNAEQHGHFRPLFFTSVHSHIHIPKLVPFWSFLKLNVHLLQKTEYRKL